MKLETKPTLSFILNHIEIVTSFVHCFFIIGLAVDEAIAAHVPNIRDLQKQIIKHYTIDIIHEYLAHKHKDWGKSILRLAQLILQAKMSVATFDGQCCSDSKYKFDLSINSFLCLDYILMK